MKTCEPQITIKTKADDVHYKLACDHVEKMSLYLNPSPENLSDEEKQSNINKNVNQQLHPACILSRPLQRKLLTLVQCQLFADEDITKAIRTARCVGERIVAELLSLHQFPHQLSANLWAAVRQRGCQFLGPAMQEEVLKLILFALEDGSYLTRKVLVLFVVQRLEKLYPQASKTAIGHVVQLLYRASCFKVCKREEASSLMQLKEEFRQYELLRREHDSQIVEIAIEAGLRISPEQWSSLLYGDLQHKSHMQSIIDKHQSPLSFTQSISELMATLQKIGSSLVRLGPSLEFLSHIDPSLDSPVPGSEDVEAVMRCLSTVLTDYVDYLSQTNGTVRQDTGSTLNLRYKTSMCRDFSAKGQCPRGTTCSFAHSQEELERYRARCRKGTEKAGESYDITTSSLTSAESSQLRTIQLLGNLRLQANEENQIGSDEVPLNSISDTLKTEHLSPIPDQHQGPETIRPAISPLYTAGVGDSLASARLRHPPPSMPLPASHVPPTRLTFSGQNQCPDITRPFPGVNMYNLMTPEPLPYLYNDNTSLIPKPPVQKHYHHHHHHHHHHSASYLNYPPPTTKVNSDTSVHLQEHNRTHDRESENQASQNYLTTLTNGPDCALQYLSYGEHPATPQTESLENLTWRKNQILSHLQQEPTFKTARGEKMCPQQEIAGQTECQKEQSPSLAQVLGQSRQQTQVMPQLVSDMFVATRSTHSLEDLEEEKLVGYQVSNMDEMKCGSVEQASLMANNSQRSVPAVGCVTSGSTPYPVMADPIKPTFHIYPNNTSGWDPQNSLLNGEIVYNSFSTSISIASLPNLRETGQDMEYSCFPNDDDDDNFIPFEQTSVSKFGPISRMARAKTNNCAPVQVTADSSKRTTPALSVTPLDYSLPTSLKLSHRHGAPTFVTNPKVKPTPTETPSLFLQNFQASYKNIACLKEGAAEAITNTERLAYELQAVELQISMKTGKKPESAGKMIQDAVMGPPSSSAQSMMGISGSSAQYMMNLHNSTGSPSTEMGLGMQLASKI